MEKKKKWSRKIIHGVLEREKQNDCFIKLEATNVYSKKLSVTRIDCGISVSCSSFGQIGLDFMDQSI